MKRGGFSKKCPECGKYDFVEDPSRGELICNNCGLVLEESMVDTGQEWRAFDTEQMSKRARAGAPLSFSVDYEEPVVIKDKEGVKIVKIGELVDSKMEKNKVNKIGVLEVASIGDEAVGVLCFDENFKSSFKPISEVSRHKVKDIYEIELETGRKVKVTGSHSVFIFNDSVEAKFVSELAKGEFLIAPLNIPSPIEMNELDLAEEFSRLKIDNVYVRNVDNNTYELLKLLKDDLGINNRKIKDWERRNTVPINVYSKLRKICKLDESKAEIGVYSSRNTLPIRIKFDKDLARFLGLFVAEGSAMKYGIVLSFGAHETALIGKVKEIISEKFGFEAREYRILNEVQTRVDSKLLSMLFRDIFKVGKGAKQKRVPNIVFNFSKDLKREFIKGYIEGDGNVYIRNLRKRPDVQVEFTTSSKNLMDSMRFLLSQLSLNLNSTQAVIPSHELFTGQLIPETLAYFGRLTNPDVLVELGLENYVKKRQRKNAIENLIPAPERYSREWKSRKRIRISKDLAKEIALKHRDFDLLKICNSDFIFLRIKDIKKVKPTTQYVYDLTVPGYENFGGTIYYHNTKHDKGITTEIGKGVGELYKVPAKKRAQYYRLTKWHKRLIKSKDRNLSFAFSELQRIVSFLGLPKTIHERIARYYEDAVNKGLVRGRSIESVIAALTYAVSRELQSPRTLDEIAEASGIDRREIGRTHRYIARELNLKILPADPTTYVPRFCTLLGLSDKVQAKAIEVLKKAKKFELTSGKGPTGVAAAAIYIASVLVGEKRTQREIADLTGITEVTIRNRQKEIAEKLGIEEEVEKKAEE